MVCVKGKKETGSQFIEWCFVVHFTVATELRDVDDRQINASCTHIFGLIGLLRRCCRSRGLLLIDLFFFALLNCLKQTTEYLPKNTHTHTHFVFYYQRNVMFTFSYHSTRRHMNMRKKNNFVFVYANITKPTALLTLPWSSRQETEK